MVNAITASWLDDMQRVARTGIVRLTGPRAREMSVLARVANSLKLYFRGYTRSSRSDYLPLEITQQASGIVDAADKLQLAALKVRDGSAGTHGLEAVAEERKRLISALKRVNNGGLKARKAAGEWQDNPQLRPLVDRAKRALWAAEELYRKGDYKRGWSALEAAYRNFRKVQQEFRALRLREDAAALTPVVRMIGKLYEEIGGAASNEMIMQRGPEQPKWMSDQIYAILARMPPGDDL